MELLKEIKDNEYPKNKSNLELREASRAVLFDKNKLIPIMFVSKKNYHKLPGGGIDAGENKEEALKRECLEEVGSEIEVIGVVGKIIEYRSKWNIKQTSYCFYGNIISKGESNLTKKEISEGFKVMWVTIDDAISKLRKDVPEDYQGKFIRERDLAFLEKVKEITS